MFVTRLVLKNWRNFVDVDVSLRETTYVLGANATGKSNLLDVFRFLRDISKSQGGGLQKAIADRGGISKLRCLHARRDPEVLIRVDLSEGPDNIWRYVLGFTQENRGARRVLVSAENVWQNESNLLKHPNKEDLNDVTRLTQIHLEQIQTNESFRPVADFFWRNNVPPFSAATSKVR
jgi:predicted ATPase